MAIETTTKWLSPTKKKKMMIAGCCSITLQFPLLSLSNFVLFKNCQSAILCFVFVLFFVFSQIIIHGNNDADVQWSLSSSSSMIFVSYNLALLFVMIIHFHYTTKNKAKQNEKRVVHCPIIFSILFWWWWCLMIDLIEFWMVFFDNIFWLFNSSMIKICFVWFNTWLFKRFHLNNDW